MDDYIGTCMNIDVLLNSNFSGLSIATTCVFIPPSANSLDQLMVNDQKLNLDRNQESYVGHKRCNKHGFYELGTNCQIPIISEIGVITQYALR